MSKFDETTILRSLLTSCEHIVTQSKCSDYLVSIISSSDLACVGPGTICYCYLPKYVDLQKFVDNKIWYLPIKRLMPFNLRKTEFIHDSYKFVLQKLIDKVPKRLCCITDFTA